MSEVEQVAKAMRDADPLGRGYRGDVSAYFPQARVAIAALDSHRAAEKRKNCKHHNPSNCTDEKQSGTTAGPLMDVSYEDRLAQRTEKSRRTIESIERA